MRYISSGEKKMGGASTEAYGKSRQEILIHRAVFITSYELQLGNKAVDNSGLKKGRLNKSMY